MAQARDEINLAEQEARLRAAEREALQALIRSLVSEIREATKVFEDQLTCSSSKLSIFRCQTL